MAKHNETGIKGEKIAENFLLNNGYQILARNWRHEKKEVDIIALKDGILVFVEVKARNRKDFGFPEDAVGLRKQDFLKIAAAAYMDINPAYQKIQFDIVSVMIDSNGNLLETLHIQDAFY